MGASAWWRWEGWDSHVGMNYDTGSGSQHRIRVFWVGRRKLHWHIGLIGIDLEISELRMGPRGRIANKGFIRQSTNRVHHSCLHESQWKLPVLSPPDRGQLALTPSRFVLPRRGTHSVIRKGLGSGTLASDMVQTAALGATRVATGCCTRLSTVCRREIRGARRESHGTWWFGYGWASCVCLVRWFVAVLDVS